MAAGKTRTRSGRLALLGALVCFLSLHGSARGATRIVHVGRGGTHFVDDVSGTSVTTINLGDTVNWVWEGEMEHSVTSGNCNDNGGGGGYGGGYGGGGCNDSAVWQSSGLHGAGSTFSYTFLSAGTVNYFCAMHLSAMTGKIIVQTPSSSSPCVPGEHTLCLNGGRFQVTAHYQSDTAEGEGNANVLTDDTGYFWFFTETNVEVIVKVLPFCSAPFNSYWVFSAGLTQVGVVLTVTDTHNGAVYTYTNPIDTKYITDTNTAAFPTSCP